MGCVLRLRESIWLGMFRPSLKLKPTSAVFWLFDFYIIYQCFYLKTLLLFEIHLSIKFKLLIKPVIRD